MNISVAETRQLSPILCKPKGRFKNMASALLNVILASLLRDYCKCTERRWLWSYQHLYRSINHLEDNMQ